MNRSRRIVLQALLKTTTFVGGGAMLGIGLLREVLAAEWNKTAFAAEDVGAALKGIGATNASKSRDIEIKVPEIAENGAVVPIEVTSRIPHTQSIAILVEKNPFPLIAEFNFLNGAEGFVSTRIKMAESSNIKAVIRAGGEFYTASKSVQVTIGGCGDE